MSSRLLIRKIRLLVDLSKDMKLTDAMKFLKNEFQTTAAILFSVLSVTNKLQ